MTVTDNKMARGARTPWKLNRSGAIQDGVITKPTISVNADPTKFDVSAFSYAINGTIYHKAATAANVFSAVHATGIAAWLGVQFTINRDGTIVTIGNPNTGDQDFATEALALASIQNPPAGSIRFGTLTLLTGAADWDANTDSLSSADLVAMNLAGVAPDNRLQVRVPGFSYQLQDFRTWCRSASGVGGVSVLAPKQGTNQVVTSPKFAVDRRTVANGAVTKLRHDAFSVVLDGVLYYIAAATQLAFTAAHVVAIDSWGAILLQYNPVTGTYSTKVSGATQVTPQAYANSAAARANLPEADAGNIAVGVLVIEADNSTWTANTDDIVAGSDLEGFDLINASTDRVLSAVTLSLDDDTPEDFAISGFDFVIDGVRYTKAAAESISFTANHVCALDKYLAILICIDAAGAVSTRVPLISGRSQTASQGYDTPDDAIAALPNPFAGTLAVGYILVGADAGAWTANTDDLVPGSDLESVRFVGFTTLQKVAFSMWEATTQNDLWPVVQATFAANQNKVYALPGNTAPVRGFQDLALATFVFGTTLAAGDAKADDTIRPYFLSGDV